MGSRYAQVCAGMRIPGLGSPDWVTLDSVTSNSVALAARTARLACPCMYATVSIRYPKYNLIRIALEVRCAIPTYATYAIVLTNYTVIM